MKAEVIKKVELRSALHGWGETAVVHVGARTNLERVASAAREDGWTVVGVNIPERKVYLERDEAAATRARERDLATALEGRLAS